jgi:HAD superfamily hydrolase (TIGR01509 family)
MAYRKLVIFDMDGLMFDTEKLHFDSYGIAAKEFGYTMTKEIFCRLLGGSYERNMAILREEMGPDYPLEEVEKRTDAVQLEHIYTKGVPVKPGLRELLRSIKEKGILCAVASSSPEESVMRNLKSVGMENDFDILYFGDKVKETKPAPDIFLGPCRDLGVDPADALVLEDSHNGILAAHRAGIPVVCIPDMKYPEPEFAEKTLAICENLLAAEKYLEK